MGLLSADQPSTELHLPYNHVLHDVHHHHTDYVQEARPCPQMLLSQQKLPQQLPQHLQKRSQRQRSQNGKLSLKKRTLPPSLRPRMQTRP